MKEDIKVPSRDEVKEVIKDAVLKNKKLVSESVKSWVDMMVPEGSYSRELVDSYQGGVKKLVDDRIKAMSNQSVDETYYSVCQSLGLAKNVKKTVIRELSKRGYNAMTDEASVGGHNGFAREGADPLILFDNSILNQVSIKEVTKREEQRAHKKDQKWQGNAQRSYNRNPNGQWSAMNLGGKQFMENDFLQHYGVKGMKWGVRRDLRNRSMMGYRAGQYAKQYGKSADKLEARQEKRGYSERRAKSIKNLRTVQKRFERAQKKLYKNLSDADIKQGARAVKRSNALKVTALALTGGAIGGGLYGANRAYQEYKINKMTRSSSVGKPRHGK